MTEGDWELVEATMDTRGHWTVPWYLWGHQEPLPRSVEFAFVETRCGRIARFPMIYGTVIAHTPADCPDCVAFREAFLLK